MPPPIKAGFILTNVLGHKSHALNLKDYASSFTGLECTFSSVPTVNRKWSHVPVVKQDPVLQVGLDGRDALGMLIHNVDVAFMHTETTAFFSTDLMKRIPTIISLDATQQQWFEMNKRFFGSTETISLPQRLKMMVLQKSRFKHRMYERVMNNAVHLVSWSEWAKIGVCSEYGVDKDKVTVIPPGVETTRFKPADRARSCPSAPVKILFVGGDFYRKGGESVLRWAREARTTVPWELHIVTRDEVKDVPANVRLYNNIQNNSSKLIELFEQSDLFVLPTLADTFGIVLLEAMASGLPVVASRIAAIPEIITEGENGYLFEPDDFDQFAGAVTKLVEDRTMRHRMGEASRRTAIAKWSMQATYGVLLELIETLASKHLESKRKT